ncbi:MAG: redoxin domain-containing protein [Caldisericia bacterium]|nr:redoxin domain-containing protein [Caldisericia bacterium]
MNNVVKFAVVFLCAVLVTVSSGYFNNTQAKDFKCDIVFYKNKYIFKIGGQPYQMPVSVYKDSKSNKYMIPLRYITSSLRYDVNWKQSISTASFDSEWGSFSIYIENKDKIELIDDNEVKTTLKLYKNRLFADSETIIRIIGISLIDYPDPNAIAFSTPRARILMNAPNFVLKDTKDVDFDLYKELEKQDTEYIILNFYATRCPFCLKALPMLVDLSNEYVEKKVRVIGVNTDTNGQTKVRDEKIEKYNVSYRVVQDIDNETYDKYSVAGVPNFYVVDKNHDIVYHSIVSDKVQIDLLKEWLDQHLNK